MSRYKGTPNKKPFIDRFNEKYYIDDSGCWLTKTNTYGFIHLNNKKIPLRSASWYLKYGELPTHKFRNLCGNLTCINPDHYIQGSPDILFFRRVTKTDTCWIWDGDKDDKGYGRVSLLGFSKAHRLSWFLHNGEIPDGLLVCHKCDNPSCVNPDHLFLGTHLDNNLDKVSKNRQHGAVGISNSSAKLSDIKVKAIRFMYDSGEFSTYDLEKIFNVSRITISRVVRRKLWKHVSEEQQLYET